MMRRKLLHRMKEVCGATSLMMKDELMGEHQVDGTRLLFIKKLIACGVVSNSKYILSKKGGSNELRRTCYRSTTGM